MSKEAANYASSIPYQHDTYHPFSVLAFRTSCIKVYRSYLHSFDSPQGKEKEVHDMKIIFLTNKQCIISDIIESI